MSDAEVDALFKNYSARKALLTKPLMYKFEEAIRHSNSNDNFGQARRTALAVLTVPCKKLMRDVEKNRDIALAFASAEDLITDYSKLLKELSDLVDEAHKRLMIALSTRPDMAELIEEAKRSNIEAGKRNDAIAHVATDLH